MYTESVTVPVPDVGVQVIVYWCTTGLVPVFAGTVMPNVAPVGAFDPDQPGSPAPTEAVHAETSFEVHESDAAPPEDGMLIAAVAGV